MLRGELRTIAGDVSAALGKSVDRDTRLHLEDVRDQIALILDSKVQPANAAPTPILPNPIP
jgi:hypothetical protein